MTMFTRFGLMVGFLAAGFAGFCGGCITGTVASPRPTAEWSVRLAEDAEESEDLACRRENQQLRCMDLEHFMLLLQTREEL